MLIDSLLLHACGLLEHTEVNNIYNNILTSVLQVLKPEYKTG